MNRKYLMMAAVAAALAGPMAAHAQQTDQQQPIPAPQPVAPAPTNPDLTAAPAPIVTPATDAATPASATTDASGVVVVAMAPVPDTPANRAKYGKPMSRAGRHTAPAGN